MPKLKVLLDTNVIISALYVGGKPLEILELAESGDIAIFLSPFIHITLLTSVTYAFIRTNRGRFF